MPSIEVDHRGIVGESRRVAALVMGADQKAEKLQVVLGQEGFDRRQRQPMLLDMKHQVTTVARGEEVEPAGDRLHWICAVQRQQVLAAPANVVRRLAVTALGNEGAGSHHVLPRELTVEAYMHHAAGTEQ